MCIATPDVLIEKKDSATGPVGVIEHAGKRLSVDLSMAPEAQVGDTILYFRGSALRVLGAEEAQKIRAALGALADVMDETATEKTIEAGFADLIENPGQLPEHLKKELEKKNNASR